MGTSARISVSTHSGRHRGLFLVPREATVDFSRGEAAEYAFPLDSLAHAHRIVAQVEHEIELQAARERALRFRPAHAASPQPSLWSRAVSFFRS